jgi:hypothetical protein
VLSAQASVLSDDCIGDDYMVDFLLVELIEVLNMLSNSVLNMLSNSVSAQASED